MPLGSSLGCNLQPWCIVLSCHSWSHNIWVVRTVAVWVQGSHTLPINPWCSPQLWSRIECAVKIIPFEINVCIFSAFLVCDLMILSEDKGKLLCTLLVHVLNAKVINYHAEHDDMPFVLLEAWGCGSFIVFSRHTWSCHWGACLIGEGHTFFYKYQNESIHIWHVWWGQNHQWSLVECWRSRFWCTLGNPVGCPDKNSWHISMQRRLLWMRAGCWQGFWWVLAMLFWCLYTQDSIFNCHQWWFVYSWDHLSGGVPHI